MKILADSRLAHSRHVRAICEECELVSIFIFSDKSDEEPEIVCQYPVCHGSVVNYASCS
jgi:hypothetical protein